VADEDFASFDFYVGVVVQRLEFSMYDFVQFTGGVNADEFLELGYDVVSLANLVLDAVNGDRYVVARMRMMVALRPSFCGWIQFFHC